MLKHKITGIIMGALMLSGVVLGGSAIHNVKTTNDNTKVVNKVLLAAPSSTVGERAVVVNTDNSPLVLYSNASANSTIISYISVGEMLTIQSAGNNFYKVKVQETGAVGYISAHNLQIITSGVNDAYNAVNKQGYIINVSSVVNLRANATMKSNILAKLTNNTKINVLGKQGQWYKVNCNGTIGYIYQEYIGIENNYILNKSVNKKMHNNIVDKDKKISNNIESVNNNIFSDNLGVLGQIKSKTNILAKPNINSKSIYTSPYGIGVLVLSQQGNWYKVSVGLGGIVGYVPKSDISLQNNYYKLGKAINKSGYIIPEQASAMTYGENYKFVDRLNHKQYKLKENEKVFVINRINTFDNGEVLPDSVYLIKTSSGLTGYYFGGIKIDN